MLNLQDRINKLADELKSKKVAEKIAGHYSYERGIELSFLMNGHKRIIPLKDYLETRFNQLFPQIVFTFDINGNVGNIRVMQNTEFYSLTRKQGETLYANVINTFSKELEEFQLKYSNKRKKDEQQEQTEA